MWRDDPEQIITFPPGATADEVIERMIAILQAAVPGNSTKTCRPRLPAVRLQFDPSNSRRAITLA